MTTDELRAQALDRIRRRRNFWTHAVVHVISASF
jgi:hypothetical protein